MWGLVNADQSPGPSSSSGFWLVIWPFFLPPQVANDDGDDRIGGGLRRGKRLFFPFSPPPPNNARVLRDAALDGTDRERYLRVLDRPTAACALSRSGGV